MINDARLKTKLVGFDLPQAVRVRMRAILDMISFGNRKIRGSYVFMPVLVSACAIPISMLFWIANVAYSILSPDPVHSTEGVV